MNSMAAISKFKHSKGITDGVELKTQATAYRDGEEIYDDSVSCFFAYEVSYMQYRVNIHWTCNDTTMRALGLHGSYNTNYQEFSFDGSRLTIDADDIEIIIE